RSAAHEELSGSTTQDHPDLHPPDKLSLSRHHPPLATTCRASSVAETLLACELVEKRLAPARRDRPGQDLPACFPQLLDPGFVPGAELLLEFFSQPLRQRRTLSTSRDRNLKVSAVNDRGVIKIAVPGIVHHVAKNLAALGLAEDLVIHVRSIGGRDHQEHVVKVGGN